MPREILLVIKRTPAVLARPLSPILVKLEMQVELVLLDEALSADRAGERALSGVKLYVLVQVSLHSTCGGEGVKRHSVGDNYQRIHI